MRIAIDIDSTLHHYWDGFAAAARRRFGIELPYGEQTVWHISQLRPEQVQALVEETHRDENVLAAEPYPGAVEAIARWHGEGHFIHITSHRADSCHRATATWLEQIGLPYDELYCSYDKVARCAAIGIDILIDDSPRNLEGAVEAGIKAATLLHPWNRDVCEEEGILCAEDWPALAELLEPVLAGAPARP
ncbi:MAG: uncharacterized protein QOK31_631 [Solirubrobacteraceae bacterium]|nr:uncharacterized protein [Solirubrobacteraceae bacterium]